MLLQQQRQVVNDIMATTQVKFGEWLIATNIINAEQLQEAIQYKKKSGKKLGQALIALKFITEKQFLDSFSQYLNIPFYDLKLYHVDPTFAQQLPVSYARLYRAIILKKKTMVC